MRSEQQRQLADGLLRLSEDQRALAAARAALEADRLALQERERTVQRKQQRLDEEADAVKDAARQQGLAEGTRDGERAAHQSATSQRQQLETLLGAMAQARLAMLDENRDMLVEIVFAAVCRVLGQHAATRAGIASMVDSLLEEERAPQLLTVRLHPDDARLFAAEDGPSHAQLRYQADARVALGGCLIDSARGTLDARLELQVELLRATLTATRRRVDGVTEAR